MIEEKGKAVGNQKRTLMWELARIAKSRPCPDCGAEPTFDCVTLQAMRGTEPRQISLPHPSRYPGGNRRISDLANAAALKEQVSFKFYDRGVFQ